MTVSVP